MVELCAKECSRGGNVNIATNGSLKEEGQLPIGPMHGAACICYHSNIIKL